MPPIGASSDQEVHLASFRRWIAVFVHNLFSDGSPGRQDRTLFDGVRYQALRRRVIERELGPAMIVIVKSVHTLIFVVILSFIVHFTWSAIRNRVTGWTVATFALVLGEGIILGVNAGRCPLTAVVEDLGDEHGEVADIFLPAWVARHIAHISCTLLGIGMIALLLHRVPRQLLGPAG